MQFVIEETDAERLRSNLPVLTFKLLDKPAPSAARTVTQPEKEGCGAVIQLCDGRRTMSPLGMQLVILHV